MTTQIYTTEYLNNATASRYYISDRDVADNMSLPYEWRDIKIKPNEIVTAYNINSSIAKLYDNLLYIISQSMTPQSLIPSKSGYTSFLATIGADIDSLSAVQSYPRSELPVMSGNPTKLNDMDTGLFVKTASGHDCGVLFVDDEDTPSMIVLRDDINGDMTTLDSTDRIDNYTNRTFGSNNPSTAIQALGLASTAVNNWWSTSWFMDAGVIFYNPLVALNWVYVPGGRLGAQWLYVYPMGENKGWLYSETLGWIWVSEELEYYFWHHQTDAAGGSPGWMWAYQSDGNVAQMFNETDKKWYDVEWVRPDRNTVNTSVTVTAPGLTSEQRNPPVFGAPSTKYDTFDNILYMLNPGSNNIFRYDISGLTQHDNSYFDPETDIGGKLLLDIIGGRGDVEEDVKYNDLRTFSLDPTGNLYIVDSDNTITYIKKYDKNTNHIATYNVTEDLKGDSAMDMTFVKDRFYLLASNSVYEFSTSFDLLRTWGLKDELRGDKGEVYRTITPSRENENVVYISTQRQVFKKFISKLDTGIGSFQLSGRELDIPDAVDIRFVSTVDHGAVEHVYVGDAENGAVYKFVESSDYQRVLNTSFESRFISLNDMSIKGDEFVTNMVYNKSMAKLFYNHALVAHSIVSKLVSEYAGTKTRKFKTLQYVLQEYVQSRSFGTRPKLGNFVGINEMLLCAVINRTLEKIFDYQMAIMGDMKTHVIDSPSYVATLLTSPVDVATLQPSDKYAYSDGVWTTEDQLEE